MGLNSNEPIWTVSAPTAWPDAPAEMTLSTLVAIEACARRWALGAAHYPELWEGRGYPPRVQLATLSGTVVHLALEVITRALVKAGCKSLQDPTVLRVLKYLGGYTGVVNECINRMLEHLVTNPRAHRVIEYATRSLRAQVPELRTRVQTMLCRQRLHPTRVSEGTGAAPKTLHPLGTGIFPELTLRARQINWKGKADLLTLSEDTCEIIDYKTGATHEHHEFQIRVYALLWSRDNELNPDRRRADRLVLAYGRGDVEVISPNEADLDDLERELTARTAAALTTLAERPPAAKPDPNQCPHCGMRHMCAEYWSGETQRLMGPVLADRHVADATLSIVGRHGPSSWDTVVVSGAIAEKGRRVLLRADGRSLLLEPRQIVRVLSAYLNATGEEDETDAVLIFTLGAASEVFVVP